MQMGKNLEQAETFTYLGFKIMDDAKSESETRHRD